MILRFAYFKVDKVKIKKIDATKSSFRFRQISPTTLRKKGYNNYKTVGAIEGVNLIIAFNDAL